LPLQLLVDYVVALINCVGLVPADTHARDQLGTWPAVISCSHEHGSRHLRLTCKFPRKEYGIDREKRLRIAR
jgi:hypothetical protein